MLLTEKYVLYFIVKQSKAINILQISKMCWNAKSTPIIVVVVVVNVILLLYSTSLSLLKLFITIVILGMMMMAILQIPANLLSYFFLNTTFPNPVLLAISFCFSLFFLLFLLLQHCYPPISKTIISFLTLTHHINSKSPK